MSTEEDKGWFAELVAAFGDDEDASPREREMVRSPTPKPPVFVQGEDEEDMDFRLRQRREKRAYDKLLRDMDASPENYMVPAAAAQAEANEEISRYERKQQLDTAEQEVGTQ
jgi:hypothetical protein